MAFTTMTKMVLWLSAYANARNESKGLLRHP